MIVVTKFHFISQKFCEGSLPDASETAFCPHPHPSPSLEPIASTRFPQQSWLSPIADIYARNFTVSEMHLLVAFYRTPAGQKFLDKSSVVTEQMATIGQGIGHTLGREMHERMIEELRKRDEKL